MEVGARTTLLRFQITNTTLHRGAYENRERERGGERLNYIDSSGGSFKSSRSSNKDRERERG